MSPGRRMGCVLGWKATVSSIPHSRALLCSKVSWPLAAKVLGFWCLPTTQCLCSPLPTNVEGGTLCWEHPSCPFTPQVRTLSSQSAFGGVTIYRKREAGTRGDAHHFLPVGWGNSASLKEMAACLPESWPSHQPQLATVVWIWMGCTAQEFLYWNLMSLWSIKRVEHGA